MKVLVKAHQQRLCCIDIDSDLTTIDLYILCVIVYLDAVTMVFELVREAAICGVKSVKRVRTRELVDPCA